jgi:hypothetical protein
MRAEWCNTSLKGAPLGDLSIGCIGHSAQRRCENDERCDVQEAHGSKRMVVVSSSGYLINIRSGAPKGY